MRGYELVKAEMIMSSKLKN